MNRKELRDEQRRINRYRKQGKSEHWIKSWLRGWRLVGKKT